MADPDQLLRGLGVTHRSMNEQVEIANVSFVFITFGIGERAIVLAEKKINPCAFAKISRRRCTVSADGTIDRFQRGSMLT